MKSAERVKFLTGVGRRKLEAIYSLLEEGRDFLQEVQDGELTAAQEALRRARARNAVRQG